MKTENLRVNQLSTAAYDWYLRYLAALDAKDVDAYGAFLADQCVLQINNGEPVIGKAAILPMLGQYWSSFGELEHELLNIFGTDASFALEAVNHYTRADGRSVTLRAVACTDRDGSGQVTSARLYSDTSPLFG